MEDRIDYKKMYLALVHATKQAINLLIQAQQLCEEIYITSENFDIAFDIPPIVIL